MKWTWAFILFLISQLGLMACGVLGGSGSGASCVSGGQCKIYISSAVYSGNLGGVSGADRACSADLNRPLDGSIYKALIADDSSRVACQTANCSGGFKENLNWVLHPNTKYTDTKGNIIVTTNLNGIWTNGALAGYINSDHSSNKNSTLLTGMSFDFTSSSDNCSNWSSDSGMAQTASSLSQQIPEEGASTSCGSFGNSLICVQQ